jgi:hypothetical protein
MVKTHTNKAIRKRNLVAFAITLSIIPFESNVYVKNKNVKFPNGPFGERTLQKKEPCPSSPSHGFGDAYELEERFDKKS